MGPESNKATRPQRLREALRWMPGPLLPFGWFLALALLYLAPALIHASQLGPFDILDQFGLGNIPGVGIHNISDGDLIQEMMPWTVLSWQQVHAGHLPLWNPFSGLGLPLAFNLQSAPFSLPALVSYAFPLSWAFSVVLVVKMLVAGTGAWVFSRVMGLGRLAAIFAGTTFELSGAFTGWLGWPLSGVFCWLGWILAAAVLVIRGKHVWRDVGFFALVLALAVLGGHPESLAISLLTVVAFCVVMLAASVAKRGHAAGLARTALRLIAAAVAGLALSAPLLLPGLQVVSLASKSGYATSGYLPLDVLANFSFARFFGLPIAGQQYFGPWDYYETAAYVGVAAVVLAAVAVLTRWRRAEVLALSMTGLVLGALVFIPVLSRLGAYAPLGAETWTRSLVALDLVLAVLAAFGLQTMVDRGHLVSVQRRLGLASLLAAAMLLALGLYQLKGSLSAANSSLRASSFLWPALGAGACLGVAALLIITRRRSGAGKPGRSVRVAAAWALLAVQTAFLLTATPDLWPSTSQGFSSTAAEVQVQKLVGSGRVAFSSCPAGSWPDLGVLPEANDVYGISELDAYDPTIPKSWYKALGLATGTSSAPSGHFCPTVSSAAVARQLGVSWILVPAGQSAPSGTTFAATIDSESLYSVPGGGVVTLQPASSVDPSQPAPVVRVATPSDATMHFSFDATQSSVLEIHVSDLPGWSATIDGHPLKLQRLEDAMLQASVPAGDHTVTMTYDPATLNIGFALAGATAAILLAGMVLSRRRARARSSLPDLNGSGTGDSSSGVSSTFRPQVVAEELEELP